MPAGAERDARLARHWPVATEDAVHSDGRSRIHGYSDPNPVSATTNRP